MVHIMGASAQAICDVACEGALRSQTNGFAAMLLINGFYLHCAWQLHIKP